MTEEERRGHRQAAFDMDMDEKARTWLRAQELKKEILQATEEALLKWAETMREQKRTEEGAEDAKRLERPTRGAK